MDKDTCDLWCKRNAPSSHIRLPDDKGPAPDVRLRIEKKPVAKIAADPKIPIIEIDAKGA